MKIQAPTKSYSFASIAALIIGAGAYGIGLFNADMALNEKGYYLAIILYGLFSMVSLQKTIRDKLEGFATSKIYYTLAWVSSGFAIALLTIGLINADLLLSEKGFFAMAYVLSLFAAVSVQKNVRDRQAFSAETNPAPELIEQPVQ
ncbi:inner membrane protein YiaA [Paraglaciecola aquimarina]|uniref:Inner membrane protein YiaA n=1 Tax=Paraglaciecola aquimarina TaxID=1235557 RepID=A0ABU3SZK0_9ALTE|nr:inner membrane protein YiaA [Paraglaciecola aquimarina]MDU0355347.1 inner membrane protein YiaA [Paraglaciecola aquimarina]